jgi:ribosomal-protein-serine acetyltransferase
MNGKIEVRPYREGDESEMVAAALESVAEVSPWMPWCHAAYSREDAAAGTA